MEGGALMRRIALAAAVLTFCLLALGGVVTSRDAGMIFRDWPLSDRSINPPGWLTNAEKFSEHGHRILGALTGMATVALALVIQRRDRRRWLRVTAWAAVAAVIGQGLLGGLRVTESDTFLALFHGCTGQMFFCLMVALAYFTGRDRREPDEPDARLVAAVAAGAWIATLIQIVLGARVRHIHGPINAHLLGALVVSGSVLWVFTLAFLRHGPALRRPAALLLGLLAVQVGLGLATADVLAGHGSVHSATFGAIALPSVHQAVGAVVIALETILVLRAWTRRAPAPVTQNAPVERRPAPARHEAMA